MSISSGALDCIRKAISNELMRVAISGSPDCVEPHLVQLLIASSESRCSSRVDAGRVRQVQHRIAAAAELHALIDGRQEAAAPAASCRRSGPSCPS